ncbi:hypothetical protein K449DRAFT_429496 [Hypoxylon sp. EC38]|nr:hypothetical protein K449DRAFT_429496 [Hypoxylon sp. EC38]
MTSLSGDVPPNTTGGETSTNNAEAEDIAIFDVTIGPEGRDPSATLPRILNFLRDEDIHRLPSWPSKFEKISKYVEEADAARLRGELGYDSPHVAAQLEDARIMIKTHRDFDKSKNEPVPWSTHTIPSQPKSTRLPNFPRQYIQPVSSRSKYKHLRFDYLPRNKRVQLPFPELSKRGNDVVHYFRLAEELFFERNLNPENITSSVVNGFQLDNDQYERCLKGGIAKTRRLAPLKLADDIPVVTVSKIGNAITGPSTNEPDTLIEYSTSRGWQRAALQQCLNMFTNHENRVINTPWRRVVLPFVEPVPEPKEIIYYPRALAPESVPRPLKEPFGWVHSYNQYRELMNVLAGQQRRSYNLQHWDDFERPALPMNFNGPLSNWGLSVYDDHWIRMGSYLRRLHILLQETYGIAPRAFLGAILRDIQAGIEWRPNNPSSRRRDRVDIMRRPRIDVDTDDPDAGGAYLLLDEGDAAWLRFLCQPSRTAEMCDFNERPKDNLSIIFDNRLQEFLFNPNACPSPGSAALGDIFDPDVDRFSEISTKLQPTLEQARAYINGGKGAAESHGNETYQFTQAEAEYYLRELSELNRCSFRPKTRPLFDNSLPDSDDEELLDPNEARKVPTTVGRPHYDYHPEHRILWRYPDDEAFESSKSEYRDVIFTHLINAYELDKLSSVPVNHFEFMFDHFRNHSLPTRMLHIELPTKLGAEDLDETLRLYIQDELTYERGSYPPEEEEEMREAPSWSDLLEWELLPNVYEGTKDVEVPVPERTSQFLRNLAFRMGRTIAHAEEIERRLQFSAPSDESVVEGKTQRWEPMSKAAMGQAYQHWCKSITYGAGTINLRPPTLTAVIEKADPDGTLRSQFDDLTTADVDIVREGLINNCVENRNTMYPSRLTALEDSSGHIINEDDYEPNKVLVGYKRPCLFKWATEEERRYQAPYCRQAFFSMKRWPLHHQSDDGQQFIKGRKDEVIKRDPSRMDQKYGLLTARVPGHNEKKILHGTAVYPEPFHNDNDTVAPVDSITIHGSAKNPKTNDTASDRRTKEPNGTKNPKDTVSRKTKQREGTRPRQETEQTETKDPIQTRTSDSRAKIANGQNIQITRPTPPVQPIQPTTNSTSTTKMATAKTATATATGTSTAAPAAPAAEGPPTQQARRNLVPITRPTEQFFPGPCVFPMAETPLQQMALSQQLERMIFPEKEPTLLQRVTTKYKEMTEVKDPLIPMLPPTEYWEVPKSTSRKRKIPAEFITRAATEAAKKRKSVATQTSVPTLPHDHSEPEQSIPDVQPEVTPEVVPEVVPEVIPEVVTPVKPTKPVKKPTVPPVTPATPAKPPTPATSPVEVITPATSPVKPPTPATSPIKPLTPAANSAKPPALTPPTTGTPGTSPVKPTSPEETPEVSQPITSVTAKPPQVKSNLRRPQITRPTQGTSSIPVSRPPPSIPDVPTTIPTVPIATSQPTVPVAPSQPTVPVSTSQPTAPVPEKKKVAFRSPRPGDPEFAEIVKQIVRDQHKREAQVARERELAAQTPEDPATSDARDLFNATFADGWARIGEEGTGIDGAMNAIVGSIAAASRYNGHVPTQSQLRTAWDDDSCVYNAKKTFASDELFRLPLEQANAALQFHMANAQTTTWVQIGCVYRTATGGYATILLDAPHAKDVFNTVYWIYSDGKNTFSSIKNSIN